MTNHPLDTDQVLDLMFNGFTREGACMAVAESHGQGMEYAEALLATDPVRDFPEMIK